MNIGLFNNPALAVLGAVLCCVQTVHAADAPTPTPGITREQYLDALKQVEKAQRQEFQAQKERDRLIKVTENTFLESDFRPLPGSAVLLVAGVRRWENAKAAAEGIIYIEDFRNQIHFEVVQGSASLLSITAYTPGQTPTAGSQSLDLVADYQDCASVWLVLPLSTGAKVRVRATFSHRGKRVDFEDASQVVEFDVNADGADQGHRARLKDYLRSEFANRRRADRQVTETQTELVDPKRPERPGKVEGKLRAVKVDGRAQRQGAVSTKGLQSTLELTDDALEAWELGMPRDASHQANGGRFAVVKELNGGYLVEAYEAKNVELGPVTTILLSNAKGTLICDRSERSAPFESRGHRRWGREQVRRSIRVASGQGEEVRVRKTKALGNRPENWKREFERGDGR